MKIGGYVTCINNLRNEKDRNYGLSAELPLTVGKDYKILNIHCDFIGEVIIEVISDIGKPAKYYSYRFSLSERRNRIIDEL